MSELMNKAQRLLDKYANELASCGIEIKASRKYFETNVSERNGTTSIFNTAGINMIFDDISRANDRKRENKKGYNYRKNQYHCLVLSVIPLEKDLLKREFCKDYAFLLRKVERAHIGDEPRNVTYEENKLLSKIEKRILKIIKKAKKTNAKQACEDTVYDALRYSNAKKYEYKTRFCGKSRFYWEIFSMFLALAVFAAVMFTAFLISRFV